MLAVALIRSITSNNDKIAIQASIPLVWAFVLTTFEALVFYPIMLNRSKHKVTLHGLRRLALVGLAAALTILFHMLAIELALVAYVISIKRLSVLFSVVFGYFVFRERGMKERLLGASIMIGGVLLISLL